MKKLMMFLCLTMFVGIASGQTLRVSLIDEFYDGETKLFCVDTLIVYVDSACWLTHWYRLDYSEEIESYELIVTESEHQGQWGVYSPQCDINTYFITVYISSPTSNAFNPFDEPFVWKRRGDTITLGNPEMTYVNFQWSTGESSTTIDVVQDGTYTVEVDDPCGPKTYSIQVRDNVEISLATCDLETNLNMVTWQTTPAQAQYIDHVIVKRDGMEVGTANYADGQFLDAIGSGAASRTYTLVAVTTDGTECPIVSYPKETIHMSYTLGMGNTIEIGWNTPTGYDLLGYNICEWLPDGKDGNLTVIDFVGASVTSYTCSENLFNNGHVVVQGVENGKTESRLLSNRSEEGIVGLGEQQSKTFQIHPNPSNGAFIVEGPQALTVFNMMGQVVATSHAENGIHTISLGSAGVYFVRNDEGVVRKVVVK
jgi:hypothetical protein